MPLRPKVHQRQADQRVRQEITLFTSCMAQASADDSNMKRRNAQDDPTWRAPAWGLDVPDHCGQVVAE
jgi:hypothetical protein